MKYFLPRALVSALSGLDLLATARSLGYVPDPIARRLSKGQNNLLGLYTFTATFPTNVQHSYYPFLVGIEEEATDQGYDLLLFTSSATAESGPLLGRSFSRIPSSFTLSPSARRRTTSSRNVFSIGIDLTRSPAPYRNSS